MKGFLWQGGLLWRGSLLPLGCEAAPNTTELHQASSLDYSFSTAAPGRGSVGGSKLPRHKVQCSQLSLNAARSPARTGSNHSLSWRS
ncbi:hypothetical protein CD175_21780 [Pseudomonas laurylsulfatiphila]|uniref:Uncharacterized protein n=1 Tax=Pseudomonas laurylsulfatiphila TaxID=2011015 RepID=A0A2S6FFR0_9PSED|nr:hypothetical protein CD175_21780 [Pseudomonas laurylsulfatiphila]